jgi:SNF2 family DNA or RNA helicase
VVVNLDSPWNPARLEQRIARAWRQQQDRPVQVINLISEDSIEQRLLHALEAKRGLAAGALDGEGEARLGAERAG